MHEFCGSLKPKYSFISQMTKLDSKSFHVIIQNLQMFVILFLGGKKYKINELIITFLPTMDNGNYHILPEAFNLPKLKVFTRRYQFTGDFFLTVALLMILFCHMQPLSTLGAQYSTLQIFCYRKT